MVFKDRPRKPRTNEMTDRIMARLNAQSENQRKAQEAFEAGRRAEEAKDDEAAVAAYQASCEAWEAHHTATGHDVPPGPYERLAIIFRRHQAPDLETHVLERYLAHGGRTPDPRLQARLERAEELLAVAEEALAMEEDEDPAAA